MRHAHGMTKMGSARMYNKKGVSPIIAWILILGLSISLGVFVTEWYLKSSKTMTENTLSTLEGGIECNDVNVNVAFTKHGNDCIIKIANTGQLKIDSVKINNAQKDYGKNPKEYKNFTTTDIPDLCTTTNIVVIPILKTENNLINCPNDKIYKRTDIS